jgi:hypothetical protein
VCIHTAPDRFFADALKLACTESDPPAVVLVGAAAVRADAARRYRKG